MFADFEVKLTPKKNWETKFINIFKGITLANNETDYRNRKGRIYLNEPDNKYSIIEQYNRENYKYYVLIIESSKYRVKIRANSRISLEYIIYHATQKDVKDTGRPLTFYPHLSNFEAPLIEENLKQNNYQGFLNLILLIVFLTNLDLIYRNFLKYGFLLTPSYIISIVSNWKNFFFIFLSCILVLINTILTYGIEKFASTTKNYHLKRIYVFHIFNIASLLIFPLFLHKFHIITPISGLIGYFIILCFSLKLISYAHFWYDVRKYKEKQKQIIEQSEIKNLFVEIKEVLDSYPNNITFSNLLSFLFKPCLCYQVKYPTTSHIRIKFILIYTFHMILGLFALVVIVVQYIMPILQNSFIDIENKKIPSLFTRIIRISIPVIYSCF